jgi:hypothetical protein
MVQGKRCYARQIAATNQVCVMIFCWSSESSPHSRKTVLLAAKSSCRLARRLWGTLQWTEDTPQWKEGLIAIPRHHLRAPCMSVPDLWKWSRLYCHRHEIGSIGPGCALLVLSYPSRTDRLLVDDPKLPPSVPASGVQGRVARSRFRDHARSVFRQCPSPCTAYLS